MTKREKLKKIKSICRYFQVRLSTAFEKRDNAEFDWYLEGEQAFLCIIQSKPITLTPRAKDLRDVPL